jgi:hypothetical protein
MLPNTPAGSVTAYSYTPCSTTGLSEKDAFLSIDIYPNPSNGYVNLRFKDYGKYTSEIFSMEGKLIHTTIMEGTDVKLKLDLVSGIYFIRVTDIQGQTNTLKLLIE